VFPVPSEQTTIRFAMQSLAACCPNLDLRYVIL
jgi:hypothetical protein